MPTIKDALDIIGKLTVAEQESLKTMLLSPAFVKSLNIEDGRVCPLCGWLAMAIVKMAHSDMYKSFVIIVSGTRKGLSEYIDCMIHS